MRRSVGLVHKVPGYSLIKGANQTHWTVKRAKKSKVNVLVCIDLMEAEVILDGVRAEEDGSVSCDHQDEAVQGLQGGHG